MGNRLVVIDDVTGIRTALSGTITGQVPVWNNTTKAWSPALQAGQTGSRPYQIAGNFTGAMVVNEVLMTFIADRPITISSTGAYHQFWCTTLPSSNTSLNVYRRVNSPGATDELVMTALFTSSVSMSGNGLYPAFSVSVNASFVSLSASDRIQVVAGNSVDPNITNLIFTLFVGA
jgi:hypothetical protein